MTEASPDETNATPQRFAQGDVCPRLVGWPLPQTSPSCTPRRETPDTAHGAVEADGAHLPGVGGVSAHSVLQVATDASQLPPAHGDVTAIGVGVAVELGDAPSLTVVDPSVAVQSSNAGVDAESVALISRHLGEHICSSTEVTDAPLPPSAQGDISSQASQMRGTSSSRSWRWSVCNSSPAEGGVETVAEGDEISVPSVGLRVKWVLLAGENSWDWAAPVRRWPAN